MKKFIPLFFCTILTGVLLSTCKKDGESPSVNVFSLNEDRKLGKQMEQYIRDSSGYVLLDTVQYADVYSYMNNIKNQILNDDDIKHKDDFEWKLYIIKDDTTLNAFATPGGYIYIYTGLMKYLTCDDHFIGVLGHEIAHADQRHSTEQLTKNYGIQTLFNIVLGKDQGKLAQVTEGLIGLKFSREAESEADAYSVKYLCGIPETQANGAAGFFKKLLAENKAGSTPQFLSTHPSPANRVEAITAKAVELKCDTIEKCSEQYHSIVARLPK